MKRTIAVALAAVLLQAPPHLVLTGVGRWAVFADAASITREGDGTRMRAFQVAETDFTAGGQAYWGGWSWWRFDCAAGTADRLDFAMVEHVNQSGLHIERHMFDLINENCAHIGLIELAGLPVEGQ